MCWVWCAMPRHTFGGQRTTYNSFLLPNGFPEVKVTCRFGSNLFAFWAAILLIPPLPSLFTNSETALSCFSLLSAVQVCTTTLNSVSVLLYWYFCSLCFILSMSSAFWASLRPHKSLLSVFFWETICWLFDLFIFWIIHTYFGVWVCTLVCACVIFCLVKFAQLFWWVFCVGCLLCYTHANISCKLNSLGLEQWLKGWEHWLFFHRTRV